MNVHPELLGEGAEKTRDAGRVARSALRMNIGKLYCHRGSDFLAKSW
jgi:hypothetical protein